MPDCSQWDAIADATLKVWFGGGYQLAGCILLGIAMVYKPWFRTKRDG